MVSTKVVLSILLVLGVLVGFGLYGSGLPNTQHTASNSKSFSSSSQASTSLSCFGTCTTIEAIIAGAFQTALDKSGTGGTTVTVKDLKVLRILTETDGDWHVYVTDGQVNVFITEIIPRDQAAEGKPPLGSTIDETGTPYCDTVHASESWHGNTCWEIHPVTNWVLSSSTVAVTTTFSSIPLNVMISYAYNPITRGSSQTITVAVHDSDGPVPNQGVHIHVTYASGSTTKDYDCTTVGDGTCSYTWVIGSNSNPGTFQVSVSVEGMTYGSSFEVKS